LNSTVVSSSGLSSKTSTRRQADSRAFPGADDTKSIKKVFLWQKVQDFIDDG
jgi:hypothetical protein